MVRNTGVSITFLCTRRLVEILDGLVEKELFRSRSRVIELCIHEWLDKRNLINY